MRWKVASKSKYRAILCSIYSNYYNSCIVNIVQNKNAPYSAFGLVYGCIINKIKIGDGYMSKRQTTCQLPKNKPLVGI